jgi:hypothetical protein
VNVEMDKRHVVKTANSRVGSGESRVDRFEIVCFWLDELA